MTSLKFAHIRNWLILAPLLIMIIASSLILSVRRVDVVRPVIESAQVNLSELDPATVVDLSGPWDFYDHQLSASISQADSPQLVQVPGTWPKTHKMPFGYGTYQLQVNGLAPGHIYALEIQDEASAYRLRVNGQIIMGNGQVGDSPDSHVSEMKEELGYFLPDPAGKADIRVEISNFNYNSGGFWNAPILGEPRIISYKSSMEKIIDVFLISTLLSIGSLFLALYLTKTSNKPVLYFALITLIIALRLMVTSERLFSDLFANISWDLEIRLGYLSGFLLLPAFGLFFHHLGYIRRKTWIERSFIGLAAILSALALLTPISIYGKINEYYGYLVLACVPYFLTIIILGLLKRQQGSLILLISILIVIPAVLLEIFGRMSYSLVPHAIFYMLMFYSLIVVRRTFDLQRQHDYLEETINIDAMTGLYNRYFLNQKADQIIRNQWRFDDRNYILFLDLNRFKSINDRYGHATGDSVLIEAARRFKQCFRDTDLICRYGGDEFVVIVQLEAQNAQISQLVERLHTLMAEPFQINGLTLEIGVSVGISEYHQDENLEKLITESDRVMYQSKHGGKLQE